jgi:tetratricopeptide (TPR) repeat protein
MVSTWQAVRATHEAERARAAETEVREQAARARAVSDFLKNDVLKQASPFEQPNANITLREAIERAAAKIDSRFREHPLIEAELHAAFGEAFFVIDDVEAAKHLEVALQTRQDLLGDDHRDTLRAGAALAEAMHYKGGDAKALISNVLATQRRVLGDGDLDTILSMVTLADIVFWQGDFQQSEALLKEAIAYREKLGNDIDSEARLPIQIMLIGLAFQYTQTGKLDDAEQLYLKVVKLERQRSGAFSLSSNLAAANLADVYLRRRQMDKAESYLAEAVPRIRKSIGDGKPGPQYYMAKLARVYTEQGRFTESESLLRELLEQIPAESAKRYPPLAGGLNDLMNLYREFGRYNETEKVAATEAEELQRAVSQFPQFTGMAYLKELIGQFHARMVTIQVGKTNCKMAVRNRGARSLESLRWRPSMLQRGCFFAYALLIGKT